MQDNIYSEYRERVSDFAFDQKVVSVFDDMIRRSVPGYATAIAMSRVFAQQYAQPNSNCYDLGCSLGASTLAMRKGITQPGCKIIAVDNSPAMIERCHEIIDNDVSEIQVDIHLADIIDIQIENASVITFNYVLQFIDPKRRDALIQKIYDGMLAGGVLLLSEKIRFEDAAEQEFQESMYHNFKHLMGYSHLEISQKRKALENVLTPDTLSTHKNRLQSAGFKTTYVWNKCFNFASIAAYK